METNNKNFRFEKHSQLSKSVCCKCFGELPSIISTGTGKIDGHSCFCKCHQTNNRIREEFEKEFCMRNDLGQMEICPIRTHNYTKSDPITTTYAILKEQLEDWWLSKIAELLKSQKESLVEKIKATQNSNSAFMTMTNEKGEIEDWILPVSEIIKFIKEDK